MTGRPKKTPADGIKFKLNGGPYSGITVRLYPENPREVRLDSKEPIWADLTLGGETYVPPDRADQSEKKPFLMWSSNPALQSQT